MYRLRDIAVLLIVLPCPERIVDVLDMPRYKGVMTNIPKNDERLGKDGFTELVNIMTRLRGEGGCPWDRKQDHVTLKRYLIEETAELLDAIDAGDDAALEDELGDVLLQVVFHAQIAAEAGRFDAQDVARRICEKLVRRHPHVFGETEVADAEGVVTQWEAIKAEERRDAGKEHTGALQGVPGHLPALHRAYKVQKKAAKVGFDWPDVQGVIDKVREELAEVEQAMAEGNREAVMEEVGDLLFAVTNLSRFLGHFPEDALHQTVRKFEHRFAKIEAWLAERGQGPADATLDELEALWQRAKRESLDRQA
ncbi:nucleoside triphosphate pyrophosphohydrolase [Planctomycetota bacterium]